MAELTSRVQNALDEDRILILGTQILIGFGFRAFFESGFDALPAWARTSQLCALGLLAAAFGLLVAPSPFHQLVEEGSDSERMVRAASGCASAALLPFALALGLGLLVATSEVEGLGGRAGLLAGGGAAALALACWYLLPALRRRPAHREEAMSETPIDKKISHVLTEARMVLPGAQALLGFQLAVMMMEAFHQLPRNAQWLHLTDVLLTALAVVLLMAPAAYHRIAERGEETARFHRVASRFVLAAMAPLALALSGDMALVTFKLTESASSAAAVGGAVLVLFAALWLAWPLAARGSGAAPRSSPRTREAGGGDHRSWKGRRRAVRGGEVDAASSAAGRRCAARRGGSAPALRRSCCRASGFVSPMPSAVTCASCTPRPRRIALHCVGAAEGELLVLGSGAGRVGVPLDPDAVVRVLREDVAHLLDLRDGALGFSTALPVSKRISFFMLTMTPFSVRFVSATSSSSFACLSR